MSKSSAAAEPSMEEILASIRRIIADEDPSRPKATPQATATVTELPRPVAREPAPAALPREQAEPPLPPAPSAEDVLDLAMAQAEAEAEAEAGAQAAPPAQEAGETVVVSLPDAHVEDVAFAEPVLAPPPAAPPAAAAASPPAPVLAGPPTPGFEPETAEPDGLLSRQVGEAVSSAFGSLAHAIFSREPRTVEDLTKELLRPMLKEWLDDNLPTIVERLVREEIERVARGRR
jgi:cell pole-organizing protein PopZ